MNATMQAYGFCMAIPDGYHVDTIEEAYGSAHGNYIT